MPKHILTYIDCLNHQQKFWRLPSLHRTEHKFQVTIIIHDSRVVLTSSLTRLQTLPVDTDKLVVTPTYTVCLGGKT